MWHEDVSSVDKSSTGKKMKSFVYVMVLCFTQMRATTGTESGKEPWNDFPELFEEGRKAYLANHWKSCITLMEEALKSYHQYTDLVLMCREQCQQVDHSPLVETDVEHLQFFEHLIRRTLCLVNCKKQHHISHVPVDMEDTFHSKKPYDYLQLCYYKIGDQLSAASAALTNHLHNPNDEVMAENMKWYTSNISDVSTVINREPYNHTSSLTKAIEHYNASRWLEAAETFETALQQLLRSEELCRLQCEKPFDMGWLPDFITSISNHFVYCLKCKQLCQSQVATLDGSFYNDLLPLIYNYLQFSYYKLGDIQNAAQCTESFLRLKQNPGAEEMEANKEYYINTILASPHWFQVRPEAEKYYQRDHYEKLLLEFVNTEFAIHNVVEPAVPQLSTQISEGGTSRRSLKLKGDLEDLLWMSSANKNEL